MSTAPLDNSSIAADFHRWAEEARALSRAEGACLILWDGESLRCASQCGRLGPRALSLVDPHGLAAACVSSRATVECADTDRDPRAVELRQIGIRSAVLCPLQDISGAHGVIAVFYAAADGFSPMQSSLLELHADRVSAMMQLMWTELAQTPVGKKSTAAPTPEVVTFGPEENGPDDAPEDNEAVPLSAVAPEVAPAQNDEEWLDSSALWAATSTAAMGTNLLGAALTQQTLRIAKRQPTSAAEAPARIAPPAGSSNKQVAASQAAAAAPAPASKKPPVGTPSATRRLRQTAASPPPQASPTPKPVALVVQKKAEPPEPVAQTPLPATRGAKPSAPASPAPPPITEESAGPRDTVLLPMVIASLLVIIFAGWFVHSVWARSHAAPPPATAALAGTVASQLPPPAAAEPQNTPPAVPNRQPAARVVTPVPAKHADQPAAAPSALPVETNEDSAIAAERTPAAATATPATPPPTPDLALLRTPAQQIPTLNVPPPAEARPQHSREIVPNRPLRRVLPAYPAAARMIHARGTVLLRVQVMPNGDVGSVTWVSGNPVFRDASTEAVRQWKYQPAEVDGRQVESNAMVQLDFAPQ